ncbi:uncharacterized protein DUF3365 [Thiogranum longum]|uniref:Uncharacterized protein DUF3365 n=1 Tax=Thiogranum longum TaxID=1537524 RepID=A0A4R1H7B6_9GAMM|nr:DUF3365 domain-containing protein [Thiogranum longum]TCK17707.1 uncharacterized protein DUF3365 [Thiogranum longum]
MKINVRGLLAVTALITASTFTLAGNLAPDADIQARIDEANTTAAAFLKQLGGTMKHEMQSGGPVAAMSVCRDAAPKIANDISLKKGWKVTRVGTRVRNPMLGMPDAWEQRVLQSFEKRAAQGEKYSGMTHYEVVEEPAGKSLRYMKAIGTAPQCMVCHGSTAQIAQPVRERLNVMYPHDKAVGYKPGDLRGAVSIKQPLED